MPEQNKERHWARTRTATFVILALWVFFSFIVHAFASSLNESTFLGFPLGFYMAAQGSLFIFVVMIFVHNMWQDAIDKSEGFAEEDSAGGASSSPPPSEESSSSDSSPSS